MIDGFDIYSGVVTNTGLQAKWTAFSGRTAVLSMGTGRFGGHSAKVTAGNSGSYSYISRTFTAGSAFTVGVAFKCDALPIANGYPIVWLKESATVQLGLILSTTGQLSVYRMTSDTAGTLLGTESGTSISAGAFAYIEFSGTVHDTTGTITIKVNGATVISLSSQDTRNAGSGTVDTISIGQPTNAQGGGPYYYDDLYIIDSATSLGEFRVETLYPTSDVAQGFGRSAGSTNYTLVDEAQTNGDTDYVQGSSVGDVDTYGFGNLSSTPTSIAAVQMTAFAEKTDATSRSIALQVKSGATTSDGSDYALAATYGKFERILETDPNTSSAWTGSAVDAIQGGPKVTV